MKMRIFEIGIKFDLKLLNKLKKNNNSGVEIHNRTQHLALHPIHLNDLNKSIKDVLSAGITKYNKELGGILLGYKNIRLPVDIGLINYDSCYIHMDVEADFFVFKPEIDKELQGIVNRKSKDHVGVLVYNAFNVSLPKPQTDEDWLGSSINIGDEVAFRITQMNLSSYLPYIKGELMSVTSAAAVNNMEEKYLMNYKKALNKKTVFDDEGTPIPRNSTQEKRHIDTVSNSKHKSKKRKFDASEETALDDAEPQVKRKKKDKNEGQLQELEISVSHVQKKKKHKTNTEFDKNIQDNSREERITFSQDRKKKKKLKQESVSGDYVQESQLSAFQGQRKKKHQNQTESEENIPELQNSASQPQQKKYKSEREFEGNVQEQQISLSQKKKKLKRESESEDSVQEHQFSVSQTQKKKKHRDENELEEYPPKELILSLVHKKKKPHNKGESKENMQEQQMSAPQTEKRKKYKHENETDEENKRQKRTKKRKENESSLTDFNLSELFNETRTPIKNIKSHVDSDDNLTRSKHSSKKPAQTDYQNKIIQEKIKLKKENLKKELNVSVNGLNTNLSESFGDSQSKKSRKRTHSFAELDYPDKTVKRKSA